MKCAVIDDDPEWIDLIRRSLALSRQNVDVIAFTDPNAALRHLVNERVDLVITDLQMPLLDGLMFIKKVRQFDKTTPIILISADNSAADQGSAFGANAFVRKGALSIRLASTLEELLAGRKEQPEPLFERDRPAEA